MIKPDKFLPRGARLIGIFDVPPMGKPRETRRDAWNPSKAVQKYRAQRDKIKLQLHNLKIKPEDLPRQGLHLTALISPPKSWPKYKKKAAYFETCDSLPDCDNILKGFLDAVFYQAKIETEDGIQSIDDRVISGATTCKIWVPKPMACLVVSHFTDQVAIAMSHYAHAVARESDLV